MNLRRMLLAALVFAAALTQVFAEERIERFISEVDVQRNGDLIVTEFDPDPGRRPTDQTRHPARLPDHLSPGRRFARRGRFRDPVRDARRQLTKTTSPRRWRTAFASASAVPAAPSTPARISTSSNIAPRGRSDSSRSTTSSTGTRPAPAGPFRSTWPRRASTCRTRRRSCRARSTPGRRARAGATPPSSSWSRAISSFARPGRCRWRTASPSRRAGSRAWCTSPRRCRRLRRCSRTIRRCWPRASAAGSSSAFICLPGFWSAAIRPRAPSFRCSARPRACRRPASAMCMGWAWTTGRLPPRSSASASTAVSS